MWQLPPITPEEILLYSRKSRTDDPTLSVEETLAKHEQMMDEWIERNLSGKGRIPEENRFREVVSGETIESRPEVQEVLRKVESPRYKAVLIVEPQRLSRGDLEDIGRMVKLLRYSNTIVITLQYIYDLRDDRDRDQFERELKRGNEFLEYTKRIMWNGRLLSVENGNYIGNYPPYGYKKVAYKDGKRKCYTLEPIPEEAAVVKMVFEMYREGQGSIQIAQKLNSLGIKPPRGEKWNTSSLVNMKNNEHYLGKVVWNRRKGVKVVEDGEVVTRLTRQREYLVYPGKHPAIIDQELWDAVQALRRNYPPVRRGTQCVNPFAGLVYCECGSRVGRRSYFKDGKEICPPRLVCKEQTTCGNASCTVEEMRQVVVSVLREAIEDFALRVEDTSGDEAERLQQLIEAKEKHLRELEKREVAQWDKYTQEAMPKHIFEELNARVLEEKEAAQRVLSELRASNPEPVDYVKKAATFSDALDALLDPEVPARVQNKLLKQCIEQIVYARKQKEGNRKTGTPEPMEVDVHLRV